MELKQRLQRKKLWKSLKLQLIRQETFFEKTLSVSLLKKARNGRGDIPLRTKKTR